MSKLYVPEGVWLVCSECTSTQQLAVVSQSKVKIDAGHLMATVEDKVKADFGCKKEALFTAIVMALCAAAVAVAVVGTGGLAACAIIGAAGAAGAVSGGIIGRLMPCGCASCMGSWQNHSLTVKVGGYHALLEDSISVCSKGGTIKIMFSKEAAEAYAELVAMTSNVEIANVAVVAFALPFVLRSAGTAIIGFKSGFSAALAVSGKAAAIYTIEAGVTGGAAWLSGEGVKRGKDGIYTQLGVYDYVKRKYEKETSKVLNTEDNQQFLFDTRKYIGHVGKSGKRKGYSVTDYEKMTYEREGYLSSKDGYIEERNWEVVEDKSDWKYKVEGTRNSALLPSTDKLTQKEGTYYMKEEYALQTGKDYNIGKGICTDVRKAINPFSSKDSRVGFGIDLLIDLCQGISNKLLEGKLSETAKKALLEQVARDKINVRTK